MVSTQVCPLLATSHGTVLRAKGANASIGYRFVTLKQMWCDSIDVIRFSSLERYCLHLKHYNRLFVFLHANIPLKWQHTLRIVTLGALKGIQLDVKAKGRVELGLRDDNDNVKVWCVQVPWFGSYVCFRKEQRDTTSRWQNSWAVCP